MAQNASFADFVKDAREKKRHEALAQHFLGSRGRKANGSGSGAASLNGRATSQKPTLLSRMSGVQKPRSSSAKPATSIDGKWQHDLHKLNNPNGPPRKGLNRTASTSQVDRNTRTFDKFASALNGTRLAEMHKMGQPTLVSTLEVLRPAAARTPSWPPTSP